MSYLSTDLVFWYTWGPGNPAVAAQGVGWAQELLSRLTQTRITSFDTSVNGSIVSSNLTFPLNQPIFVDATHDTIISAGQFLTQHLSGLLIADRGTQSPRP